MKKFLSPDRIQDFYNPLIFLPFPSSRKRTYFIIFYIIFWNGMAWPFLGTKYNKVRSSCIAVSWKLNTSSFSFRSRKKMCSPSGKWMLVNNCIFKVFVFISPSYRIERPKTCSWLFENCQGAEVSTQIRFVMVSCYHSELLFVRTFHVSAYVTLQSSNQTTCILHCEQVQLLFLCATLFLFL